MFWSVFVAGGGQRGTGHGSPPSPTIIKSDCLSGCVLSAVTIRNSKKTVLCHKVAKATASVVKHNFKFKKISTQGCKIRRPVCNIVVKHYLMF